MPTALQSPLTAEFDFLRNHAKAQRIRTHRQFAEQEMVVPDGPHVGEKFRCSTQPYSGILFDAMDSGNWNRFVALGPTQSGKTLCCFCEPILKHIFDNKENVIAAIPDMDMAGDKWRTDLLPVIEATRYREELPTKGAGSRDGGNPTKIQFKHGPTLKFMSGGGSDKSRSAFTSRILVVTEVDGMDEAGGGSREADKISQFEGRLDAYTQSMMRIYLECTVSIEEGRTWQEYTKGTRSRLALPCHACGVFVSPEREHLVGWKDCEDEIAAYDEARYNCPACGAEWSEAQRLQSNLDAKLVHRGQEILESGEIIGDPPRTRTLGFRWSAVNNMFKTAGDIGVKEWKGAEDIDTDNAEKKLRQFTWALPYDPEVTEFTPLDPRKVGQRMDSFTRGIIPSDVSQFAIGVDPGKWYGHWVAEVWRECNRGIVPEYGVFDVPSKHMDEQLAITKALHDFADTVDEGWALSETGEIIHPTEGWVDSGYHPLSVYQFCRERKEMREDKKAGPTIWHPAKGWGTVTKEGRGKHYPAPKKIAKPTDIEGVRVIGENYHFSHVVKQKRRYLVAHLDVDQWKTWIQSRFSTKRGEAGAMSLYETKGGYRDHMEFTTSLASETKTQIHVPGKGPVISWDVKQRNKGHYLDASTLASAALHHAGARLVKEKPQPVVPSKQPPRDSRDGEKGGWKIGR